MKNSVIIEGFNSEWALEYEKEAKKIKNILGVKIISIEHIGSTAVKGLGAKPIIDIMAGVKDLKDVDEFIEPLSQIGYEFVFHKEFPFRRFFRKGQWRAGTHHFHIYQYPSEYWTNNLLFRDYLRNYPKVLKQYYQLKKDLAEKYPMDRILYTSAKAPFIEEIINKAKNELKC
ncbi:GrpB family protein (plasmid) [Rossellomorea sp. FS2]|uniref:GrpB family protein n=1 Tax=Rossellomorea sp. FS2 TaxID=3391447 RepID=UPI003A4E0B7D